MINLLLQKANYFEKYVSLVYGISPVLLLLINKNELIMCGIKPILVTCDCVRTYLCSKNSRKIFFKKRNMQRTNPEICNHL